MIHYVHVHLAPACWQMIYPFYKGIIFRHSHSELNFALVIVSNEGVGIYKLYCIELRQGSLNSDIVTNH